MSETRRDFLSVATLAATPAVRTAWGQNSPNDTVNVAVVGAHYRGADHYKQWARTPGVRIAYLCDVDERLFPDAVAAVEKLTGYRPKTVVDIRKLLENKDLDAISIAAPDHWHALATIWGCQAGKDVYVEKPVCHSLREGRKMVEAARKYNRIVQAGLDRRSQPGNYAAARFIQDGTFGKAYRAKAFVNRPRMSIGKMPEAEVPSGVHWDLFSGPAPLHPFTLNRFHNGWHYFWDTSTAEMGNNGIHVLDQLRWALGKHEHPVKIQCSGMVYPDGSDQETPHVQNASFEYADGTLLEIEVTTLSGPPLGNMVVYTPNGYVTASSPEGGGPAGRGRGGAQPNAGQPPAAQTGMAGRGWRTMAAEFTKRDATGSVGVNPLLFPGVSHRVFELSFPSVAYKEGPAIPDLGPRVNHFQNFIDCVRSRKREDLHCEILEGHMSTALGHLANISFRTGRPITFDPATETIHGDKEANALLTRKYREPFVVPEKV
jgi:predicted dehydrogenase